MMGPMYTTKKDEDKTSSRGAIAATVMPKPTGESDMEPIRPLEQIHKDLGRHVQPQQGTDEPDGEPRGDY